MYVSVLRLLPDILMTRRNVYCKYAFDCSKIFAISKHGYEKIVGPAERLRTKM